MSSMESIKESMFTDAFRKDPYPAYAALREKEPVFRKLLPDGNYAWFITRYEEAVDALRDPRFIKDFSKLYGGSPEYKSIFTQNMLFADMPEHKRLRQLVSSAFTPKMISAMQGRIQEITDELLDDMQGKDTIDLIDDFAFPLPIIVICEILGIPAEDRDNFRIWSNTMIEGSNGAYAENIGEHMQAFTEYLGRRFAELRANPSDDLISRLIIAEEQGDQLTEQELYGVVSLLIIAGHETTVNLIGNGVLALLEHPRQLEQLREQPGLIKKAIEEILRFNGPVEYSTSRWAGEDLEFGGRKMAKGDLVIVILNSADRDPDKFDDPDVFDITRKKSVHLAFGFGIHTCLGAPLARLEGEIAISGFFSRFPDCRLHADPDELEWRPGMIVRGVKELPVVPGN
ncbi:cytochrome P450 family protein [Edaphobacillus lindanitolerans]|uniref:Cytochrome P450 n=1 Tax=Edaphobacillus lindanitolerans TaxID=550447 RepID=A0A1U7PPT8_9BACI|nr:cytochrome P450 [Edaphobacillus lindanitolerans]SIT91179.1 Cytochrome P450 [Edaphobacillus lindanitolerans]